MLREARAARFTVRRTALGRRYVLALRGGAEATWRAGPFRRLCTAADHAPVQLAVDAERVWWLFERRLFWTDDAALDDDDVHALVRDRDRRARRRLERAHDLLAAEAQPTRRRPPATDVRRAVWHRDNGRCAACGATFDLQYDHVIPLALGGSDGVGNLQLLCGDCNRRKGAAIG